MEPFTTCHQVTKHKTQQIIIEGIPSNIDIKRRYRKHLTLVYLCVISEI